MGKLFPKQASFVFVDDNEDVDSNNQYHVTFTVYDRNNNPFHFTRSQQASFDYSGNIDIGSTMSNISRNLLTCQDQLWQGILTEDMTDEAIAAKDKALKDEQDKVAAAAKAATVANTTSTTTSTNASTASTSSTSNT